MLLNELRPSLFLSEFIKLYRIIDFDFPADISIPPKLYPPRPEHCLQFAPTETSIIYEDKHHLIKPKNASIVGIHTVTNTRKVGRRFLAFQVIFQPGAMFRLLGIPADLLTNQFEETSNLSFHGEAQVNEQLYTLAKLPLPARYAAMINVVEQYLHQFIKKADRRGVMPVDRVAAVMSSNYDQYSLDWFVKESCLSHRQFDRKFYERTGIGPKEYIRVSRFDRAFRMKNKYPARDWLSVAIHCGYHDYQHMSRDYKVFTGYSPAQFFALDNNAPERIFGESET